MQDPGYQWLTVRVLTPVSNFSGLTFYRSLWPRQKLGQLGQAVRTGYD